MTAVPRVAVVVGNPKPLSRTRVAAELVASSLAGRPADLVVDLADLGPALLDWQDPTATAVVEAVASADLLVVASPTFKATYTGLLKLFLDRVPSDGLRGVVAVPLMLGAGPGHALAPELGLRPVLVELGASVPARGLYLLDRDHDDPDAWATWLEASLPQVRAALAPRLVPTAPPATTGATA